MALKSPPAVVYESDQEAYVNSSDTETAVPPPIDVDAEIQDFIQRIGKDITVVSPRDEEIVKQLINYVSTLQKERQSLLKQFETLKNEKSEIEEEYWTLKQEYHRVSTENEVRQSVFKETKQDIIEAIRSSVTSPGGGTVSPKPPLAMVAASAGASVDPTRFPLMQRSKSVKSSPMLRPAMSTVSEASMLTFHKSSPLLNIFNGEELDQIKDIQDGMEELQLDSMRDQASAEEKEMTVLVDELVAKKDELEECQKKLEALEGVEKENKELTEKMAELTQSMETQVQERDHVISEQVEHIQEQLVLMQQYEEDIARLENHINDLNVQLSEEDRDISELQDQLKAKEVEIENAKHQRQKSTAAMIIKYQTKGNESPLQRSASNSIRGMGTLNLEEIGFAQFNPWGSNHSNRGGGGGGGGGGTATLTPLRSLDVDEWGRSRLSGQGRGTPLPEEDEVDIPDVGGQETQEMQEKIFELEQEISELQKEKNEILTETSMEREEQVEKYNKLEKEYNDLQDECEELNDRIVQMKIEYRSSSLPDHEETTSLIRKDRSSVKVGRNGKKNADSCVMFGFGIW